MIEEFDEGAGDGIVGGYSPYVTRWYSVKIDIELKIIEDAYKTGCQMPTIAELANIYDIGRATAVKVYEALCRDEIISAAHGSGYFLRPFVKERLKESHLRELKDRLRNDTEYALRIGLEESDIFDIVSEFINYR